MRSIAKYNLSANCFITEITVVNCISVSLTDKTDIVIEQTVSIFQTLILLETEVVNITKVTVRGKKINKESAMQKIVIKFAK